MLKLIFVKLFSVSQNAHCDNEVEKNINGFTFSPLTLGQLNIHIPVFNIRKTCTSYYDTPMEYTPSSPLTIV
jgi:hypothetical protein